jgi:hypothetical protein
MGNRIRSPAVFKLVEATDAIKRAFDGLHITSNLTYDCQDSCDQIDLAIERLQEAKEMLNRLHGRIENG